MTKFTVNNQPVAYLTDPETPLLWALRDASNLTGAKYSCDNGTCGACIVDVDGQAVRACSVPIKALEGSQVTTIEGLSATKSRPIQQAILAEGSVFCGFCTPGFVMAAAILLATNPRPSDSDIDAAITNLCPCGAQQRMRRAIHKAGEALRSAGTVQASAGLLRDLGTADDVPALSKDP